MQKRSRLLVIPFSGIFFHSSGLTSSRLRQSVNVLFTSTLFASFIHEDLVLLRKHFRVDHLLTKGILAPLGILLRLPHADVTFTWFASVYSFFVVAFARLLGKHSIIVVGGVDASREPDIGYGIWLSPWKSVLVRWTMRHATRILVVDPFFLGEVKRLAAYDGSNVEYVPTGYDGTRWHPAGPKEAMVLTVAACHDHARMRVKGLDVLFGAARNMPDIRFVVIGVHTHLVEEARQAAPSNVEIIPFTPQEELLRWYQRAAVYCQPSFTEGLPNSLCEAMLCACVPVGTAVGGIPTAVSDIGFLVSYGDPAELAGALGQALRSDASVGEKARRHIVENFPLERREKALVRVLQECAG